MRRPQKVDFPAMANLLVVHSQSSGNNCSLARVFIGALKLHKWKIEESDGYFDMLLVLILLNETTYCCEFQTK